MLRIGAAEVEIKNDNTVTIDPGTMAGLKSNVPAGLVVPLELRFCLWRTGVPSQFKGVLALLEVDGKASRAHSMALSRMGRTPSSPGSEIARGGAKVRPAVGHLKREDVAAARCACMAVVAAMVAVHGTARVPIGMERTFD